MEFEFVENWMIFIAVDRIFDSFDDDLDALECPRICPWDVPSQVGFGFWVGSIDSRV